MPDHVSLDLDSPLRYASYLTAIVRIFGFIFWVGPMLLVAAAIKPFNPEAVRKHVMKALLSGALKVMGVKLTVRGTLTEARPVLVISNHSSYLDIFALGAAIPVSFTPKSEIARWPVIGQVCHLIDCVFIDRRPSRTAENAASLRKALLDGRAVSLFAEGTTGDGRAVLPFRSSYFQLASQETFGGKPLMVQPAVIAYTHIRNLPIDSTQRALVSWYGDMVLLPHFFNLLRLGTVSATVEFLAPLNPADFPDRKALAAHCQQMVSDGFERLMSDR